MVRLEKINPFKRQCKFYELRTGRTLFGEWCLTREWGRIGAAGGQTKVDYLTSEEEAELALADIKTVKNRRGYATIPVQLELFQT